MHDHARRAQDRREHGHLDDVGRIPRGFPHPARISCHDPSAPRRRRVTHMGAASPEREMLESLVAFDTTSRNSNLDLIAFAQEVLAKTGAVARLTYDSDKRKANLFATLGPAVDGGYVLSGHTDVVPVDGQDWSSDPFRADIREGKLYARGAA